LFVVLRFVPVSNRNKTLKPTKVQKDGKRKELSQFAQHTLATLGSGSMLQAVKLPKGEDVNEWLAVNSQSTHRHDDMRGDEHDGFCASCVSACVASVWIEPIRCARLALCRVCVHCLL